MKKLSTCLLALVIAGGSSMAMGAPHQGERHHKGEHRHQKHDFKVGRHHDVHRIERGRHHNKHLREHRRHHAAKEHRRHHRKWRDHRRHRWDHYGWRYNGWDHRPWRRHHWRHGGYYGDYVGAAILGSALTFSLYHRHNGAICYDRHDDRHDPYYREGRRTDVVGCHRIERLADGTEVRVDVPLEECQ